MNSKGQKTFRLPELRLPGDLDKESYVEALYRTILLRDPDPHATRFMTRNDTENFFLEFLSSAEFRKLAWSPAYPAARFLATPSRSRILLFGAYGNGNLGDAIQASSLARAIGTIRPDIEVWACSALPAPYPFAHERTLPAEAIINSAIVNSFDLLIIGGGGLLAHPHDPLRNPEWQAMLELPLAIVGVGAAEPVASGHENLIRKAVYLSGRDSPSIISLSKYGKDALMLPDPVLCDQTYFSQLKKDSIALPAVAKRKLWILKYLNTDDFRNLCHQIVEAGDTVCFLEPRLDFPILQYVPNAIPIYFVDDLISIIDQADIVLSMRYHGCILAMLRQKTVFGLREQKIFDLLFRYENSQAFSTTLDYSVSDQIRYAQVDSRILQDQANFLEGLSAALSFVIS